MLAPPSSGLVETGQPIRIPRELVPADSGHGATVTLSGTTRISAQECPQIGMLSVRPKSRTPGDERRAGGVCFERTLQMKRGVGGTVARARLMIIRTPRA
jgi:hypothetical protein